MLGNLKNQRSVCPSDQEIDLEVMKGNKEWPQFDRNR